MFHLVEGLNCSGKSTWINQKTVQSKHKLPPISITTSWMNPLRWSDSKKNMVMPEGDDVRVKPEAFFQRYAIGAYETFMNVAVPSSSNLGRDIYWDRTFISAYVYKSITRTVFDFCVERLYDLAKKFPVEIIFIDTSVDECLLRLSSLRVGDHKYRNYAWADNKSDMMSIQKRFYEVLGTLSERNGFSLTLI